MKTRGYVVKIVKKIYIIGFFMALLSLQPVHQEWVYAQNRGTDSVEYIEETIVQTSTSTVSGFCLMFTLTSVVYNPGNYYHYLRTVDNEFSMTDNDYYIIPDGPVSVSYSGDRSKAYVQVSGKIKKWNDATFAIRKTFTLTFYAN